MRYRCIGCSKFYEPGTETTWPHDPQGQYCAECVKLLRIVPEHYWQAFDVAIQRMFGENREPMSDREQAIEDVAAELGCDADILSYQMDIGPEVYVYAVSQRERVVQLERDNAAKTERVIVLERALREINAILEAAPELNMSNYSNDDVEVVNDAMIEATLASRAALNGTGESEYAPRSHTETAERASQRVSEWPEWKRNTLSFRGSKPSKAELKAELVALREVERTHAEQYKRQGVLLDEALRQVEALRESHEALVEAAKGASAFYTKAKRAAFEKAIAAAERLKK